MELDVSIIVISYNSEKTILETLESIKKQNYKNFELIITDDCSTDKTYDIVKFWVKNNKSNFFKVKIIQTLKNGGPSINANNGLKIARGNWIKLIAADDILLPNCLEENIKFIKQNPNIRICFSKMELFGKTINLPQEKPENIQKFYLPVKEQYESLKEGCFIPAPTSFIKREIFEKYGFFDEKIPMVEDWPYWLKITSLGEKIYFLNKVTVKYRISESLSNTQENFINLKNLNSKKLIYKYYLKENINFLLKWHYTLEFFTYNILITIFNNKKNKKTIFIKKWINLLDPYFIIKKIKSQRKDYE
ncbi:MULTISPECIES: glycosyltransferase [Fusobacterium]|uniref:glycosyltransferase n=1 Tax=Fusobacterium TaxID=848 RepID=UPI0014771352|nr:MULTISPECIES: glycosyltransferase [Fusobacterium]NME35812.1 glycosyltransferase [Fusobacterium sp. FSA-380-WT-3A]